MGIRGLTTYIAKHSDQYLEPYELKDCSIVIDGNNLASHLYSWVSSCNCAFGGDYDKYANCVTNFFTLLKKCGVTPVVLFDGGYETKKLSTVYCRLKNKLSTAKVITPATQSKLHFFPLFMKDVFKDVLTKMNIPFVQCDFEADGEIAALARKLGCPVLSYDSDFYVYDVLYIPFSTVVLEAEQCDFIHDNSVGFYINCKIYSVKKFLDSLGGLDKSLLPVMATILGNDYIERKVFKNFLSQLKLPKNRSMSKTQRLIIGLLDWLRKETIETATRKILNHLKKSERHVVDKQLRNIVFGYTSYSSDLLPYLSVQLKNNLKLGHKSTVPETIIFPAARVKGMEIEFNSSSDTDSETSSDESVITGNEHEKDMESSSTFVRELCEPSVSDTGALLQTLCPDWFKENLRCGILSPCFINMLVHNIHFCSPQVEDFSLPFSHKISIPILGVIFGILTAANKQQLVLNYITHKQNVQLQKLTLLPIKGTTSMNEFPSLENIPDLSLSARMHVMYDTMGLDDNDVQLLNGFPDDWKIFLFALIFWGRNVSEPSLTLCHIHAILFSIIALNVVDGHVGYYRSKKIFLKQNGSKIKKIVKCNEKDNVDKEKSIHFSESVEEKPLEVVEDNLLCERHCDSVSTFLSGVSTDECFLLVENILPFHQMDECLKSRPRSFSVSVVHVFAQFQSCLLHIMQLNALLNLPFSQCQIANFYSGTLIYNTYMNCKKRTDIEAYILNHLLKCAPSVCALYRDLVKSVTALLPNITKISRRKKKCKRKKKSNSKSHNDMVSENEENVTEESGTEELVDFMGSNRFSVLNLSHIN